MRDELAEKLYFYGVDPNSKLYEVKKSGYEKWKKDVVAMILKNIVEEDRYVLIESLRNPSLEYCAQAIPPNNVGMPRVNVSSINLRLDVLIAALFRVSSVSKAICLDWPELGLHIAFLRQPLL
jgi:hypothetical protein